MAPDIVQLASDNMGCKFIETAFYRGCLEAGFGLKAQDEARKWYTIWVRQCNGFDQLPLWLKNFFRLRANYTPQMQTFSNVKVR